MKYVVKVGVALAPGSDSGGIYKLETVTVEAAEMPMSSIQDRARVIASERVEVELAYGATIHSWIVSMYPIEAEVE